MTEIFGSHDLGADPRAIPNTQAPAWFRLLLVMTLPVLLLLVGISFSR